MAIPKFFEVVFPLWQEAQVPMQKVARWSNFPAYDQNTLHHAYSVQIVADFVLSHIKEIRPECNCELIRMAIRVHDLAEPRIHGERGEDELYQHKSIEKDARETSAFFDLTERLQRRMRDEYREAYLLQHCLKDDHSLFSLEAQSIMRYLREQRAFEARVFDVIERLDYLMSAYAGYLQDIRNDEETMIRHTVNNQVPKLNGLVVEERHLAAVWTTDLHDYLLGLLAAEAAE